MQTTQIARTQTPPPTRTAGWLLAGALVVFAAWFAAAMTTLSSAGVTNSADLTPAQMSTIRVGWTLVWPLYALALLVGLAGAALLNNVLRATAGRPWATASQVVNALAAITIIGYVVLVLSIAGFTEPRLGDNRWWDPSLTLSVAACGLALAGITLTAVALRRSGLLRRTGLVVAIIGGVMFALNLVTLGALPPFVPALLWLVCGIALLRRPVASTR